MVLVCDLKAGESMSETKPDTKALVDRLRRMVDRLEELEITVNSAYAHSACKGCFWNDDCGLANTESHCSNATADCYEVYPFAPKGKCSGFEPKE